MASSPCLLINNGGTLAVAQTFSPHDDWPRPAARRSRRRRRPGRRRGERRRRSWCCSTAAALTSPGPVYTGATLDFELADLDGDGDLDSRERAVGRGRLLNDGSGAFITSHQFRHSRPPSPRSRRATSTATATSMSCSATRSASTRGRGLHGGGARSIRELDPIRPASGRHLRLRDVDDDGDLDVLDPRGRSTATSAPALRATEGSPTPAPCPDPARRLRRRPGPRHGDPGPRDPHEHDAATLAQGVCRARAARVARIGGAPGTPGLSMLDGHRDLNLPPFGLVQLDLANLQLAVTGAIPPPGSRSSAASLRPCPASSGSPSTGRR